MSSCSDSRVQVEIDLRTFLLAIALFVSVIPITLAQTEPTGPVEYEIVLNCPGAGLCPVRAIDPQDAMGDPSIAVDPDNVDDMIIASLHGIPAEDGPDLKSRAIIQDPASVDVSDPFTTFTTRNGGATWDDKPYSPLEGIGGGYGQHPALTIDPYGHVFIGSLYAFGSQAEGFEYQIGAQKFGGIQDIQQNQNGDYHLEYLLPVNPEHAIGQLWFVYDRITDNMVMMWNEHPQQAPASSTATQAALQALAGGAAPAQAHEAPPSMSGIGMAWTAAALESAYERPSESDMIGPCDTSTNPVISEGWVYVGCRVAEGEGDLRWDPAASPGEIVMFRMLPTEGVPQYLGRSPVVGGEPKLGVRSDGRIALMTAEVVDGDLRLDASFGQYDNTTGRVEWGGLRSYGDQLDRVPKGADLAQVNIQDLIYREYSGVNHFILKRVFVPSGQAGGGGGDAIERPVQKSIVALAEEHGVLAELKLDIGDPVVRASDPALGGQAWQAYNDLADDFLELPGAPYTFQGRALGDTYQREYFAIGDYGTVIFGEMVELTNLRFGGPPPPPPPPPPPIPAPAPAAVGVLAPAGVLAASSMTAAVTVKLKRKSAVGVKPGK